MISAYDTGISRVPAFRQIQLNSSDICAMSAQMSENGRSSDMTILCRRVEQKRKFQT